jgi:hypothetical protein
MSELDDTIAQLKRLRDEARLQMHLASKEIRDEWNELEVKMGEFSGKARKFSDDAKLKETSTGLGSALGQVGHELKEGYKRIRDALKD